MTVALEGISVAAVTGGCGNPTPTEPATCYLGIATAGLVQPGAAATGYLAGKIIQKETIPELKEAFGVCKVHR